jgi:glucose-6-phosphate isomerase, archaeal
VNTATFIPSPTWIDWNSGRLRGAGIESSVKKLGDLNGIFDDDAAWQRLDPATEVYRVNFWRPVPDGTQGGLFWGTTTLQPGLVGDEYFMTHGHFHAAPDRAEYYATLSGSGCLILMDENGECSGQNMSAGSVHYIPGRVAHRVANTGTDPLVFLASWPSDAGHDYSSIRANGFSKRLLKQDGKPCLVLSRR